MSNFYYTYQNPNPSALNHPSQGHWENPADWPRTFLYTSAHDGAQGIHPPAPVYQSTQPAQQALYYFAVSELVSSHCGFTDSSLRVALLPQPGIMSMGSTMDHSLPLQQLVGLTPLLHTLVIPCPLPLLQALLAVTTTPTTTHHTVQRHSQCLCQQSRRGTKAQPLLKPPQRSPPMPQWRKCQMPQPSLSARVRQKSRLRMPSWSPTFPLNNSRRNLHRTSQERAHNFGAKSWTEVGL